MTPAGNPGSTDSSTCLQNWTFRRNREVTSGVQPERRAVFYRGRHAGESGHPSCSTAGETEATVREYTEMETTVPMSHPESLPPSATAPKQAAGIVSTGWLGSQSIFDH